MNLGQWLVIGLCVFLAAWYIIGAVINYRRAAAVMEWLKTGVDELGKLSGTGWLTALHSAGRLAIRDARSPFLMVELLFALEARENFPVWAFRHALGRRDELYVRAEMRGAPGAELDVTRRERLSKTGERYEITRSGPKSDMFAQKFNEFLAKYPDAVLKASLKSKKPHLLLRLNLVRLRSGAARDLYSALLAWLG